MSDVSSTVPSDGGSPDSDTRGPGAGGRLRTSNVSHGVMPAFICRSAGGAARAREALRSDRRFDVREIAPAEIGDAIRVEVEKGTPRVLICGGDGTISAAVNAAADTGLALAVFPAGTLNHFALDLGVPLRDAKAALDIAREGAASPVDLGFVNGHAMLNTSSLGVYVDFVRRREAIEQRLGYREASIVAALHVWRTPRFADVWLRTGEGPMRRYHTPLVFIGVHERILDLANRGARRPGGARALHVVVVNDERRPRIGKLALGALHAGLEAFVPSDEVHVQLVSEAEVVVQEPSGEVAVDGDLFRMSSPLRYEFRRDAALIVRP